VSTTANVFLGAAAFALIIGAIYWFLSYEAAGTMMLLTMAVGLLIATGYVAAARRRTRLPADVAGLSPADERSESVGVFASQSAWPALLALGCAVGLTGLIYGWWLALLGALGITAALVGLMREDRPARSR